MHPVEQLFSELSRITKYPDGVMAVPDRIPGVAFFPGGAGLWGVEADGSLPEMPIGGVMVLGHDFHSESAFRKSLAQRTEFPAIPTAGQRRVPTWVTLKVLFEEAEIPLERCFFTNAYMGLRKGDATTGIFPGSRDKTFVSRCQEFFLRQVELQKPSVILTLGIQVPQFIAPLSQELADWRKIRSFSKLDKAGPLVRDVTFGGKGPPRCTVAALTHTSMRHSNVKNRRYEGLEGRAAELRLLQDAKSALRT